MRALALSPDQAELSSHHGLSTSDRRALVRVSRRSVATGQGCSSARLSSAEPGKLVFVQRAGDVGLFVSGFAYIGPDEAVFAGRSEAQRPVTTGRRPEAAEAVFLGLSPGEAIR